MPTDGGIGTDPLMDLAYHFRSCSRNRTGVTVDASTTVDTYHDPN